MCTVKMLTQAAQYDMTETAFAQDDLLVYRQSIGVQLKVRLELERSRLLAERSAAVESRRIAARAHHALQLVQSSAAAFR